jgi:hypothetical protein
VTLKVQVIGLRELGTALGRAERGTRRELDRGLKESAQLVVKDAKRRVPLGPPPHGHARASIRSAKTGKGIEVRGGGARYPYYMWLEFGGSVGRRHHTYRKRIKSGRYIYPALGAKRRQMYRLWNRHAARAMRAAGLNVRGG